MPVPVFPSDTLSRIAQQPGGYGTGFGQGLYDFFLDQELDFSSSEAWAYEINAIFDYYPWDEVFLGVMLGTAIPKSAAKSYAGDDKIQNEVILWAGISF